MTMYDAGQVRKSTGDSLASVQDNETKPAKFQAANGQARNVTRLSNDDHLNTPTVAFPTISAPPPANQNELLHSSTNTDVRDSAPPRPKPKLWKRAMSNVGRKLKGFGKWLYPGKLGSKIGVAAGLGVVGTGVAVAAGAKIGGIVGGVVGAVVGAIAGIGVGGAPGAAIGYGVGAAVGIGVVLAAGAIGRLGHAAVAGIAGSIKSAWRSSDIKQVDNNFSEKMKEVIHPDNKDSWVGRQFAEFCDHQMHEKTGLDLYRQTFEVDRRRPDFRAKGLALLREATDRKYNTDFGKMERALRKADRGKLSDDELEREVAWLRQDQSMLLTEVGYRDRFVQQLRNQAPK